MKRFARFGRSSVATRWRPRIPWAALLRWGLSLLLALVIVAPSRPVRTTANGANMPSWVPALLPTKEGELQAQLLQSSADIKTLKDSLSAKEVQLQEARVHVQEAQRNALDAGQRAMRLQAELDAVRLLVDPKQAAAMEQRAAAAKNQPVYDLAELYVSGCTSKEACPTFIVIPRVGTVTLGSDREAISVSFKHRFAMARTEVTVAQWRAFWNAPDRDYQPTGMTIDPCRWDDPAMSGDETAPIRCVSAVDAEAYARWFAKRYIHRLGVKVESIGLPSEAEWELSARGGLYTEPYLWKKELPLPERCLQSQFGKCSGGIRSVAGRRPNGYGLFDMIGNVNEWLASPWRENRAAIPSDARDVFSPTASMRVVRGGSYASMTDDGLSLIARSGSVKQRRDPYIGFRLVVRLVGTVDAGPPAAKPASAGA
jgi:formylglycine-generating enzyme required for sulfatase activity